MPKRKEGTWWIESDSDPRWNAGGTYVLLFCQDSIDKVQLSTTSPSELRLKITELKNKYGDPPKDGEWGYCPYRNTVLPPMVPTRIEKS